MELYNIFEKAALRDVNAEFSHVEMIPPIIRLLGDLRCYQDLFEFVVSIHKLCGEIITVLRNIDTCIEYMWLLFFQTDF